MKILFVASGNSKFGISPLVKSQGESLRKFSIELGYFPILGKGIINYFKHISHLKKHLKNNQYDLIHAHYGLCGIVEQLSRGKEKLVVSFMGDDLIGAVNISGNYSLFGNTLVLVNKLFLRKYDYVIVKSNELSEKVNSENKEVIPNGVDLSVFFKVQKQEAREKLNIEANKRLVIFVSNPAHEEKNFKLAKGALDKLGKKNLQLLPVYNVEQEQLKYYYGAADLLILTSYHEGSPNVIKEAMAYNCPIVSTDVGDVRWVIGEPAGCYVISEKIKDKSKKNEVALIEEKSKKIKAALEFAELVGRTKGRERIIELGLDSETVAKKIIGIYKKVTAN